MTSFLLRAPGWRAETGPELNARTPFHRLENQVVEGKTRVHGGPGPHTQPEFTPSWFAEPRKDLPGGSQEEGFLGNHGPDRWWVSFWVRQL